MVASSSKTVTLSESEQNEIKTSVFLSSETNASIKPQKKNQLLSHRYMRFPCPLCGSLVRTRGFSRISENVYTHFYSKHVNYDPKKVCLSCCVVENPTPDHRLKCALSKIDDMKTLKTIVSPGINNNVVFKVNTSRICTRVENLISYYKRIEKEERVDAHTLANTLPPDLDFLRQDPVLPIVENYSLEPFFSKVLPNYDYSSFMRPLTYQVDEPKFRDYLSKRFDEADLSTSLGKAVRQLLSYDPNIYYHLIIYHHHFQHFSEMYLETFSHLFEITPFSCYCNTKKHLNDPDEILHVHLLARIPDVNEFKKCVWSKLKSKTGKRNKALVKIESLFHYCSVIIYLSQQRIVGNSLKHFLIKTFLTPHDELSLLLVFPFLGVQKVIHFSKLSFLLHFDIYKLKRNNYGSKFSDLFTQIGLYNIPMCGTTFDFRAKEEISKFACFGEMLIFSFGVSDTYFVWTKDAKIHSRSLFTRKVIPEKENTSVFDLSMRRTEDGGYRFSLDSREVSLKSVDVYKSLSILLVMSRTENVCLRGVRLDIDTFIKLVPSFINERDKCVKVIHENYEFLLFFDYVVSSLKDCASEDAVDS